MWRKEENKFRSGTDEFPVATPEQEPRDAPAGLNRGIKIKGEVTGQGDFFCDGNLEGRISLDNGTLTIGENSRVHAEVHARVVIIRGEVVGALKGCERVHITSTGKLTGDIETRGIVIDDGAILHSKVAVPQAVREANSSATASAPTAPPTRLSESLQRASGTVG